MRLDHRALWTAWIAMAALGPLPPADGQEKPQPGAAPASADAGENETRLTMDDIQHMRRQRTSPEQVVNSVAERGRDFEVTAEVVAQLRRLGFRPAQIDAIKEAPSEPLVPGQSLSTSDEERDETLKELKLVAVKSRADIKPIESQHVTLWAAEEAQQTYLRDVQKLEKFYHTRCAEPLRCGLDKRSTHVVVLKDHAEYEAWCRAMFDLFGKQFEQDDNPNAAAHFREEILKLRAFYWRDFSRFPRRSCHLIGPAATRWAAWQACTLHNWRTPRGDSDSPRCKRDSSTGRRTSCSDRPASCFP